MYSFQTMLTSAISAAQSPQMMGAYLAALMFLLGFVPALGARLITVSLVSAD